MLENLLHGLATGSIYALLALAVALIYQATRQINFAQGEMAMFTTFIAWQMMVVWRVPYWLAFVLTIAFAFLLGVLVYRVLIHPLRSAGPRLQIGAIIGTFLIFNSLAGFFWNQDVKAFPTPFGIEPFLGTGPISAHRVAMIGVALLTVLALHAFLYRTHYGLRLRAASENPTSARLAGIKVDRLIALGWGLAAAIGAVAGVLIAPVIFVEPQMMFVVFPYAIAAAVLGGLANPFGAVVGALCLGVFESFATAYLPLLGRELKLTLALGVMLIVLVVRPEGILSRRRAERY